LRQAGAARCCGNWDDIFFHTTPPTHPGWQGCGRLSHRRGVCPPLPGHPGLSTAPEAPPAPCPPACTHRGCGGCGGPGDMCLEAGSAPGSARNDEKFHQTLLSPSSLPLGTGAAETGDSSLALKHISAAF